MFVPCPSDQSPASLVTLRPYNTHTFTYTHAPQIQIKYPNVENWTPVGVL